jgi:hypothetical protein
VVQDKQEREKDRALTAGDPGFGRLHSETVMMSESALHIIQNNQFSQKNNMPYVWRNKNNT